jgi:signal transduction histidine kinase
VIAQLDPRKSGFAGFRAKLQLAMMMVVSVVTALALYFAERNAAADVREELERGFRNGLANLQRLHEVRQAVLVERCRTLVRKPRIHAALEDGALDLLYPSAKDELRDVVAVEGPAPGESSVHGLRAQFYRFLDRSGALITPPNTRDVGALRPDEEAQLALKGAPDRQHLGYLLRQTQGGEVLSEVMAMPIVSSETGEAIAAIVLGFKLTEFGGGRVDYGLKSGVWLDGVLHMPEIPDAERAKVSAALSMAIGTPEGMQRDFAVAIDTVPYRLFFKRLNPDSLFPPAYEVCVYPLTELHARQAQLRWRVLGAGALVLLGGLVVSHAIAARFSVPVEKLAIDSAENRAQRERVEARLEMTSEELQRSARFSADASHQLKTPVTVLRAGLEELLAQPNLTPAQCDEIAALVHQTYRLASVIEDLLLLSRMEAGRVQLELEPINLTQLIEAWLDDLRALPDPLELVVETDVPHEVFVLGEKRYTSLILQNLLENARKYNAMHGRIGVAARAEGDSVYLRIGNTGRPIPREMQSHIFERFHRGAMGENVPGHGLGLNLARELARIHKGDLRLTCSNETWTEFEVRFLAAAPHGSKPAVSRTA